MDRIVLKVGGSELDNAAFVDGLVVALRRLWEAHAVALVHGGGKAIARLQQRLCLEPRFVDGLRVTDDESLDVAEMVLSGWVNKRLVGRLVGGRVLPAAGRLPADRTRRRPAREPAPARHCPAAADRRGSRVGHGHRTDAG